MNKQRIHQLIIDKLVADLQIAQGALQTAYEAATHEENIAENKYDTLGLEAGYLAHGQAKRVAEIEQALTAYRQLLLRAFDPSNGIQLTALVRLELESGAQRLLFLGPDAAGLKIVDAGQEVMVITPRSPMGQSLLGKARGALVDISVANQRQEFEVLEVV
ncbi:transcription elongation factor GreAB [Pseudomonas cavernicola]|uniref:Transcription elongation factor GreAB n=1 Tax=Pseudomonas cavernicola TaxID=2320866 RepID=A0A418XLF2_9PSED|nr:GreA/GreB family elongation factor [Pseudomonas cavernicola]RJG13284.1 transcription elongation factor GreAB [Pseudomonas cavernicola]